MGDKPYIELPSDATAVEQGCYYDDKAAQKVITFFSRFLRHSKGQFAGEKFVLLPWQRQWISTLFGWKDKNGFRRYRKAYLEVPKKNGKSTLAAGIALYMLIADGERGAEVYLAASDREQAGIIFREAASMARGNPALAKHLMLTESRKHIAYPKTNAVLRALSADAYRNEGLNASVVLWDEVHAQPNSDLWDALAYAGASRQQPLTLAITTAGWDRQSLCWNQHRFAEQVRDGVILDTAFLPLIYAASLEDDWTQPEVWAKANPSLGVTISEESFAADCKEAQDSPVKENSFKRYRLNLWTEQEIRWIPLTKWDVCADPLRDLSSRPCWAGLDLSATTDLTSLALIFPAEDGTYDLLSYHWIPSEGAIEREKRDKVPYLTWAKQGLIERTPGNIIDYDYIRKKINELKEIHDIKEIAIDRWNSVGITTQLEQDGFTVVPFGQGYGSMSAPTKELETLIIGKKLRHGGNPVLRWEISNCATEVDAAGNIKPSKRRSSDKVDGVVAAIMGLGRALVRTDDLTGKPVQYVRFL